MIRQWSLSQLFNAQIPSASRGSGLCVMYLAVTCSPNVETTVEINGFQVWPLTANSKLYMPARCGLSGERFYIPPSPDNLSLSWLRA